MAGRQWEMLVVSFLGGKVGQRRVKEGWRALVKGKRKKGRRKRIRNMCKGKKK